MKVKKIFIPIKNYFTTYKEGSLLIKVSLIFTFMIMGSGQFVQKRIGKGIQYLIIQLTYILFMVIKGWQMLSDFISLKTPDIRSDQTLLLGLISLFITLFYLVFYYLCIIDTYQNARKINNKEKCKSLKEEINELKYKSFYKISLIIPILGAFLFTILPLSFMICLAFTDYGTSQTIPVVNKTWLSWTGLDSFIKLFTLSENFKALKNVFLWTMLWAILATFTCYFGGFLLALLLNKKAIKHKKIYRSIFVIAMALPQFVSLRVVNAMFNTYGPINTLLIKWGWIEQGIDFWGNASIAKTLIIITNMWIGIPYFMLLISGLLINIPKDYYEASSIEGANKVQQFFKITLPHIFFMTTPLLITSFVSNINNFNVIWLLTGGRPLGQGTGGVAGGTDILITWLFKLTMQDNPEYNLGAAIGILMFILSASISLMIFRKSASYKREDDFK